ncbi:hypothetical protein ELE36_10200 [Pseudolysobacter antarcticus]|uniref:DUF155 domain-containing protein n=2 Tax=Pseudolysobacter antarcticus TaxID=2511995 RepID=A0A411HQ65_9GAMM|nr:hypothetical protein ELE36_10200 [Pseudolysobacter antarcticus]
MPHSSPPISIKTGTITALRLFDIAYSIDLAQVEALWLAHAHSTVRRGKLSTTPEKAVSFDVPPVTLPLEPCELTLDGNHSIRATVSARCYDFGVVALAVQIPVSDIAWSDYVERVQAIDRAIGPSTSTGFWERLLQRVLGVISPTLDRPSSITLEEDYLIVTVKELSEPLSARDLQERIDLVPLLSGESRTLAEAAQRDLLRHSYSYFTDDLVVLTWDRAFIYEPRGDSDVADVLEVANAQLLELRYYDELLDAELPHMYDRVEETRRTLSLFAARRFAHLASRLYTLVAEVTELTEKVDNALQVTEDVYLARIYTAALSLYRVPILAAAVDRKLAIIRDTYAALYDEALNSRATLMELAIIVLIVIEIVLGLLRL